MIVIMKIFISLLLLLEAISAKSNNTSETRIVGGTNARIEDFPYQVAILESEENICGGSIFHPYFILTAAHCVTDYAPIFYSVNAGSNYSTTGGVRLEVCGIRIHEKYDSETSDYDIAILRLCKRLKFGPTILPIALPKYGETIPDNAKALVTGWGLTKNGYESHILQKVELPTISTKTCSAMFNKTGISERMFCAGYKNGGKDSCQGDSGGPLRAKGKLMGIISWGYGCAEPGSPGVYTHVPNLRKWIKDITGY